MSCTCETVQKFHIELVDIIKHNEETYSYDFKSKDINKWKEGDSSKLYLDLGEREVGKKFSYATTEDESYIRFTTRIRKDKSDYKKQLASLIVGDKITISEPSGNFRLRRNGRPIIILSNGVGIAASRSLIKAYEKNQESIPEVLQINVDSTGAIYKDELDCLMNEMNSFKSYFVSNRNEFYRKLDYETQNVLLNHENTPYIYIVGSDKFVNDSISHLKNVGFLEDDIITDNHILNNSTCGCSSTEGCGCGSNMITNFTPINNSILI